MIGPPDRCGQRGYHRDVTEAHADRWKSLAVLAAALAAAASLAFAFASPAHVEDGWEYRGFFLLVATLEMGLAVWLFGRRTDDERAVHRAAIAGAILAAASVAVYVLTYVTGVQHAGHSAETIAAGPAPLDILTRVVEVALVAVLVRLAMLTSERPATTRA